MHRGVDLSHHNDGVDFGTLKRGGIEFVALKATQGRMYADPTYATRRAAAIKVGFRHLLSYHFFTPLDDPKAQAMHFAAIVGSLAPNEAVVVDVEASDGWDGLSPEASAQAILDFVYWLKGALGIPASKVVLYGSLGWLRGQFPTTLRTLTFMPLWAARYAPTLGDTSPWPKALIWQTGDRGTVAGAGAAGTADVDAWLDDSSW